MFQVQANWRDEPTTIVGAFSTLQEAYESCHEYSKKNPVDFLQIFEQAPEVSNTFFYQVSTGNLFNQEHTKVLLTKHEHLRPLYDEISIIHDQINTFDKTIRKQCAKIQELFDTNAKNTKAPVSLSVLIRSSYCSFVDVQFTTHEPNMRALLEELKEKLLAARYLSGQLDEWIYDLMLEVGETTA